MDQINELTLVDSFLYATESYGFYRFDVSSTGYVFATIGDSVLIFDKTRTSSELYGDFSFESLADEIGITDSFLLETQLTGVNSMRISSIANLPTITPLSTFQTDGTSHLTNFDIWDQKLHSHNPVSSGTEIHVISDPANTVLLASGAMMTFDHYFDGILYHFETPDIELYDPNVSPPQLIKSANLGSPPGGGAAYWDPQ
jgi:hypothetical protein